MPLPNLISSQRTIKLPNDVKERALRWVQAQATMTHRTPQDAPFRRLIDFWFAAIAWAVRLDIRPVAKAQGDKFVSIGPTPQDVRIQQWKLDLLVLLAIREFGHESSQVQEPAEIIDLANRFAEAGAERLLAELDSAQEFAVPMLYRVSDLFTDQFKQAVAQRPPLY